MARARHRRFVWLLLLCAVSAIVDLSLVAATGERDLLALGVIPIVLTGWFFPTSWVLFTAIFLYTANAVYMTHVYAGDQPQDFARGVVAHILFVGIGAFVGLIRRMSNRIKTLNQELVEKNKELSALSLHDHLTGLYNRRYVSDVVYELAANFLARLTLPEAQKRETKVQDTVIALFMVDIDQFKSINDSYGHAVGDQVLVEISDRLRKAVRFDDIVVRWGGEEFLVVCPGVRRGTVDLILRKIFAEIRRGPCAVTDGQSVAVTVSIGCSHFPLLALGADLFSLEEVIGICDAALYVAKDGGRNRAAYARPREDLTGPPQGRGAVPYRALIEDASRFILETFPGAAPV